MKEINHFLGLNGGQLFLECLALHEVKHVFGYPGGAALPLFDTFYDNGAFEFIVSRHEQGAGHMAQGYARVTGTPGVVLVTSGPGSTNMVTPMFDAMLDGTPIVVICGQVATSVQGTNAFQEIDVMSLAKTCTKWCGQVKKISELPAFLDAAFNIAISGRPGPNLVAVPKDVGLAKFNATAAEEARRVLVHGPLLTSLTTQAADLEALLCKIAGLIKTSQRPLIICGQGVLITTKGPELLKSFAERAQIPVATTLLGLGGIDEHNPLALGMMGTWGTVCANLAVQSADLILALGARMDERAVGDAAGFAPVARRAAREACGGIVQFSICSEDVGKFIQPTITVLGDLSRSITILLKKLESCIDRSRWLEYIKTLKEEHPAQWTVPDGKQPEKILPQEVIEEVNSQTVNLKSKTIITTGVGQHQMLAARHYRWRHPRTMVTSGGLGTMGFGLPAAIGAKIARPDHIVIDIDGDASFCMTMAEVATAVQFKIDVKMVVINNGEQGMITQLQQAYYGGRICLSKEHNPDFSTLVESMGGQSRRCSERKDLAAGVQWLLHTPGVICLEVVTMENVPVEPIVPAGKPLDAILPEKRIEVNDK
ncbi:hypothetical protein ZTR_04502 [Talaromyces verruculosus]|nr:hypothetical protein ZTR_04502 [Talaromyces verruculosus]